MARGIQGLVENKHQESNRGRGLLIEFQNWVR